MDKTVVSRRVIAAFILGLLFSLSAIYMVMANPFNFSGLYMSIVVYFILAGVVCFFIGVLLDRRGGKDD